MLEEAGLGEYIVTSGWTWRAGSPTCAIGAAGSADPRRPSRGLTDRDLSASTSELHDAYLSVAEALRHAGLHQSVEVDIRMGDHRAAGARGRRALAEGCDGIVVPGGFGYRGVEGKISAAEYAREHQCALPGAVPGHAVAMIWFARHVLGAHDANSTEFVPHTPTR